MVGTTLLKLNDGGGNILTFGGAYGKCPRFGFMLASLFKELVLFYEYCDG